MIPTTMQATDKNAPAPAQFVLMPVTNGNSLNNYPEVQSRVNGGLQVLVGILAIVFNVVDFFTIHNRRFGVSIFGQGFWCGILFIVAGSFGISAGRRKTKWKIYSFMALSIISAAFSAIFFLLALIGVYATFDRQGQRCGNSPENISAECVLEHNFAIATSILPVLEAGLSIWGSVICCKTLGCGAPEHTAGVFYQSDSSADGLVLSQPGQIQISQNSLQGITFERRF